MSGPGKLTIAAGDGWATEQITIEDQERGAYQKALDILRAALVRRIKSGRLSRPPRVKRTCSHIDFGVTSP